MGRWSSRVKALSAVEMAWLTESDIICQPLEHIFSFLGFSVLLPKVVASKLAE